jgi:hypothetical protein
MTTTCGDPSKDLIRSDRWTWSYRAPIASLSSAQSDRNFAIALSSSGARVERDLRQRRRTDGVVLAGEIGMTEKLHQVTP